MGKELLGNRKQIRVQSLCWMARALRFCSLIGKPQALTLHSNTMFPIKIKKPNPTFPRDLALINTAGLEPARISETLENRAFQNMGNQKVIKKVIRTGVRKIII